MGWIILYFIAGLVVNFQCSVFGQELATLYEKIKIQARCVNQLLRDAKLTRFPGDFAQESTLSKGEAAPGMWEQSWTSKMGFEGLCVLHEIHGKKPSIFLTSEKKHGIFMDFLQASTT